MNDIELLREFEPVLCFTRGEMFFPSDVEPYVKRCSLRERNNDGAMVEIVERSELSLNMLDSYPEISSGHTLYLRFVDEPLRALDYQRWLRRQDRPDFQSSGRLSRVGLPSRLLDSLFNLSLLVRGTVPGPT